MKQCPILCSLRRLGKEREKQRTRPSQQSGHMRSPLGCECCPGVPETLPYPVRPRTQRQFLLSHFPSAEDSSSTPAPPLQPEPPESQRGTAPRHCLNLPFHPPVEVRDPRRPLTWPLSLTPRRWSRSTCIGQVQVE